MKGPLLTNFSLEKLDKASTRFTHPQRKPAGNGDVHDLQLFSNLGCVLSVCSHAARTATLVAVDDRAGVVCHSMSAREASAPARNCATISPCKFATSQR